MRTSNKRKDWQFAASRWWRFDRYEIRDGYVRPVPGAKLEIYDPWEAYWNSRKRGDESSPPYADFVNLRDALALSMPEANARLTDWCARYGLPGVLLQQVRVATFAPRWISLDEKESVLVPAQEQFTRTNTGWVIRRSLFRSEDVEGIFKSPTLRGTPTSRDAAPEAWARTGVLRQSLRSPEIFQESVRETWWKFFPDVSAEEAETYAYPAPLSEPFWRLYAEPYGAFIDGLQRLTEALWDLEHHKPRKQATETDRRRVAEGRDIFHALLAPASPAVVPQDDGSFRQEWVCGSLLSAFAMMALQDLTESRRVRGCDVCHRLFVSQHPNAQYCSSVCRWKLQKRRQREKKKQKETGKKTASKRPSRRGTQK